MEAPVCGRFALYAPASTIAEVFGVAPPMILDARYNIAPTDPVVGIRRDDEGRVAERFRWGLVPRVLAKDGMPKGRPLINARAESAATKGIFKYGLKHRRLLIPNSGFFEWKREGKAKRAHHITVGDAPVSAMAGLWEEATLPDGQVIRSCTVLTTDANDAVRPIHDRMPVFLHPSVWDQWLDPELTDPAAIADLLGPPPAHITAVVPVSDRVNSVKNDDPSCVEPLPKGLFD